MSDEATWTPLQKWNACDRAFRDKLDLVCDDLREKGYEPHMVYTWRSSETQGRLQAEGKSKVSFSFHNAVDASGQPAALACDLIDKRHGWSGPAASAFFAALGKAAQARGLTWGGDWDSNPDTKNTFNDLAHIQMYPNSALGWIKRACNA